MRTSEDIEQTINLHGDTVWRVASITLHEYQNIQDVYQDTFLRYALEERDFENDEQVKAWLIRVARNCCLDLVKSANYKNAALDEEVHCGNLVARDPLELPGGFRSEVIDALKSLTDPPRTPVYLALVEEYPAGVIAEMLDAPINTVYSWIARGKQQLKEALQ